MTLGEKVFFAWGCLSIKILERDAEEKGSHQESWKKNDSFIIKDRSYSWIKELPLLFTWVKALCRTWVKGNYLNIGLVFSTKGKTGDTNNTPALLKENFPLFYIIITTDQMLNIFYNYETHCTIIIRWITSC